jgi:transposase-like protein
MDGEVVKMVTEEGQKTSEVARSLGIYANMLYKRRLLG